MYQRHALERSHLTDDEELFIPRGIYMGTKKTFIKEVTEYQHYWNFERFHSGIGMNNTRLLKFSNNQDL